MSKIDKSGPLPDFPKLQCPFVRQLYKVNTEDFEKHREELKLRKPEVFLAIDKVNPGYEWVFEDPETFAVEKLDGINIGLYMYDNKLIFIQNRKNFIDLHSGFDDNQFHIVEGILAALAKRYVQPYGTQYGELIGPRSQGNPYKLLTHLWYPFEKAIKSLCYRSFHEHDRTYQNWSEWFENYLFSRFFDKNSEFGSEEKVMAEGLIFYNLKRKEQGEVWLAKLRRDMFRWYYDKKVRIDSEPFTREE